MPSLLSPFVVFWAELTSSFSLQLFVVSATILLVGLFLLVWLHAHHLAFLNTVSLHDIEFKHPHLPSFRTIVVMFLCCVVLLAVVLQTVRGLPPFDGPFQWLYLAAFFVLSGAVGILCELKWKGTRDIAFAIITGTVLAFLFLVFRFTPPSFAQTFQTVALLVLLVFSGALAWRDLFRSWSGSVQTVTVAVFILWLLVYML